MLLALAAHSLSSLVQIPPQQKVTIDIPLGNVLVPTEPSKFNGTVTLLGEENPVFGDTDFYILNFTEAGSVTVFHEKEETLTFYYYVFCNHFCTTTDIIINPPNNFYYSTSNDDKIQTPLPSNESMVKEVMRCFWFANSVPYRVLFENHNKEDIVSMSYTAAENALTYTQILTRKEIEDNSGTLNVRWGPKHKDGYAFFQMQTNVPTGEFLRPKLVNQFCAGPIGSCEWHTFELDLSLIEKLLEEGLTKEMKIVIAVVVVIVVAIIIAIALCFLCQDKCTWGIEIFYCIFGCCCMSSDAKSDSSNDSV